MKPALLSDNAAQTGLPHSVFPLAYQQVCENTSFARKLHFMELS